MESNKVFIVAQLQMEVKKQLPKGYNLWLVNRGPPRATYPSPEMAGLIKGLLTIGFP